MCLFLFPLGLATTMVAILLYKSQILRLLNPRLLFMYWRRSVKGVAVAKPSAAALSKVSKPNVDCILNLCRSNAQPKLVLVWRYDTSFIIDALIGGKAVLYVKTNWTTWEVHQDDKLWDHVLMRSLLDFLSEFAFYFYPFCATVRAFLFHHLASLKAAKLQFSKVQPRQF